MVSVTYLGTTNPACSQSSFIGNKTLCVPINYQDNKFCDFDVYSNSPEFNDLRPQHNHCYEVFVCGATNATIQKRVNATSWEEQTNDCVKYQCVDEIGGVSWNNCNSTDKMSRSCVNEQCVETERLNDEAWTIEIEIEEVMNATDFNYTDVVNVISNNSGVDVNDIQIATEINSQGQIIRIYVMVRDENSAQIIADTVGNIEREEECGDEYGILCQSKLIQVKAKNLFIEASNYHFEDKMITLISFLLMILFLY